VPGHHDLREAEAALQLALLIGVQIVAHVRRDHDLDAHQALGFRPRYQPSSGGP
jgi:hypothetical protein